MATPVKTFLAAKTGDKIYIYAKGAAHGTNPRIISKASITDGIWIAEFGTKKGEVLKLTKEQYTGSQVEAHGLTYSVKALKF